MFIRNAIDSIAQATDVIEPLEKIDESLTPNMRALRLAMSISDNLLSQGVAASDVVHMALGVTDTYCKRRAHLDVSSTLITISQDRGDDREPLTIIRTIVLRDANYRSIQAIQSLALDVRNKHIKLAEAEKRLDEILNNPQKSPRWVIYAAGGMVSAGAIILYSGNPVMVLLAFLVGALATGMLKWMGDLGMSTFYSQVVAALVITITASIAAWLSTTYGLGINATLIVISGIVLLVAGMMIVGAFQDAIDEYYITANARLLKVAMATGGIVVGVLVGLYVATFLGVSFPTTPDKLSMAITPQFQYFGALIMAAAFVARYHAPILGVVISGGVGMLGLFISRFIVDEGFGVVIASGIAAAVVGLMATFMSRLWKFPSMAIISAGIVPLVPGLSLYNGLMGIIQNSPSEPEFMYALAILARALVIGLAIAAGATLGNMTGRPLRRKITKVYGRLSRQKVASK